MREQFNPAVPGSRSATQVDRRRCRKHSVLFLDTLTAELSAWFTVSWHPLALCLCVCVRACTRVCPEASVRSGGLPHRCLLNGQIHTTTTTSLCPFSVLPQSCHPLFHFSLFFLFLSLSLFRPFFLSVVAVFFPSPASLFWNNSFQPSTFISLPAAGPQKNWQLPGW